MHPTNHQLYAAAVTDDNRGEILSILRDFSQNLPRAAAPRRLALDIALGIMRTLALFFTLN